MRQTSNLQPTHWFGAVCSKHPYTDSMRMFCFFIENGGLSMIELFLKLPDDGKRYRPKLNDLQRDPHSALLRAVVSGCEIELPHVSLPDILEAVDGARAFASRLSACGFGAKALAKWKSVNFRVDDLRLQRRLTFFVRILLSLVLDGITEYGCSDLSWCDNHFCSDGVIWRSIPESLSGYVFGKN